MTARCDGAMLDRKSELLRHRIQLRWLPLGVFGPESGHAIVASWNHIDMQVKADLTRRSTVGLDDV
jgi:hypothetical protein